MDDNFKKGVQVGVGLFGLASNLIGNPNNLDKQLGNLDSAQQLRYEQQVRQSEQLGSAIRRDNDRPGEIRPK